MMASAKARVSSQLIVRVRASFLVSLIIFFHLFPQPLPAQASLPNTALRFCIKAVTPSMKSGECKQAS